jgi:malate dehydrogenase (oxaloacetate-decarboxylating)
VVRALRPTALVGTSGEPGTFPEAVIRDMARHVDRPVVLPLSNPTSQSEATPADVVAWTNGRALVATGSPFPPVQHGERTFVIGQANNAFVFPGIGLGVLIAEARRVTPGMLVAAAHALAREVRDEHLDASSLFPPIANLRRVTAQVAQAIVGAARDEGVGRPLADAAIPGAVHDAMWEPEYPELIPA